jgi:hypothetical protein
MRCGFYSCFSSGARPTTHCVYASLVHSRRRSAQSPRVRFRVRKERRCTLSTTRRRFRTSVKQSSTVCLLSRRAKWTGRCTRRDVRPHGAGYFIGMFIVEIIKRSRRIQKYCMLPKGKATHCYFYDAYTCSAATHAATRLSRYSYQLPQRALPPRAPSNHLSLHCLAHSRFVRPKLCADNCQKVLQLAHLIPALSTALLSVRVPIHTICALPVQPSPILPTRCRCRGYHRLPLET